MSDPAHAPTMTAPEALPRGVVLSDRFELLGLLGEGGMGVVYRALDRELREEVALKTLRPELAASQDALARLRREVSLARRVTHPNVARTFDLGNHEGMRFVTLELLEGRSLAARRRPSLPLAEALHLAAEIARALGAAHAAGVVHRDLKPGNVMLPGARVVVTDFGLARLASGSGGEAHATGYAIVGTPAYMAPEQVEGSAMDGRTDVFALGVVLFELLTGALPFSGETPIALAAARLVGPPPDPRSITPLPAYVSELVLAMLQRSRELRPDAFVVLEQLEEMLGGASHGPTHGQPSAALELALPLRAGFSTLAVRPFEGGDAGPAVALAADLTRAVRDSITRQDSHRVVPEEQATLVCEGSVRAQDDGRVRVRVRLLESGASALWADSVDGALREPFALEDGVTKLLLDALRARRDPGAGPSDPNLRQRYDDARRAVERVDPSAQRRGIAVLEHLHEEAPEEPWIASLLAVALCKLQSMIGAFDEAAYARAEDLALRALGRRDPRASPGGAPVLAYRAFAMVRAAHADYRGALAAELEALRREPRLAEAHCAVGALLCQSGRTHEGLARLRLALRLDDQLSLGWAELAMVHAILGEHTVAEDALARAEELEGHPLFHVRTRLPFLYVDRVLAAGTAARLSAVPATGAAWDGALPMLEAFARGEASSDAAAVLADLTSDRVAPRSRALLEQVAVEYFAAVADKAQALAALRRAADNPGFVHLLWLDHAYVLGKLRGETAFAETRAIVAARVAGILQR